MNTYSYKLRSQVHYVNAVGVLTTTGAIACMCLPSKKAVNEIMSEKNI